MKILIIEDNPLLLDMLEQTLQSTGYKCETATKYAEAAEKIVMYEYDVLLVDINLPDGSGLDLIRLIKLEKPSAGIIVISARNSLDNKIEGLNLGADDYMTKPFDMSELIARVKALLRRRNFMGSESLHFGKLEIDTNARLIMVNSNPLELTKSEYDILLFFISNVGRVLTRESIAEHIWGDNMDLADSHDFIYSHIKNLRKKITTAGVSDPIKTIYGVGYKFELTQEEEHV